MDLKTHFRDGVPRWTVVYRGMQMIVGKTCNVCGYKCYPPSIIRLNDGQEFILHEKTGKYILELDVKYKEKESLVLRIFHQLFIGIIPNQMTFFFILYIKFKNVFTCLFIQDELFPSFRRMIDGG